MENNDEQEKADQHLKANIQDAVNDQDQLEDLYRSYVNSTDDPEEKARRRHAFRCGGRNL